MQIEALKVFCDVVRHSSFSKAARANQITQPAVSQVVHQLERRVGVQLIDRSVRPLRPTAGGQVYYEGCKRLLEEYLELETKVRGCPPLRESSADLAPCVEVAAIYSVGLGDMRHLVKRYEAENPPAQAHVDYLHPDQVYQRVLDGTADLGLVSFPRRRPGLSVQKWRDEEMWLACPPGHPLAALPTVRPAALRGQKFVAFRSELNIRREIDRFLREWGVDVEVSGQFDNIETIIRAVKDGTGVALLPEPTLRSEAAAGVLVARPLDGASFLRPLGIIHRRQPGLSAAARRFVDLLLEPDAPANGGTPPQPHDPPSPRNQNGSAPRTS